MEEDFVGTALRHHTDTVDAVVRTLLHTGREGTRAEDAQLVLLRELLMQGDRTSLSSFTCPIPFT